jgi:ABC-type branched-subunit amino acid transport system substrate-binding protein
MAVLLERSAWGRSNETALRELINKLPLGTVDLHWIEAGATNIDATLQQLLSSGVRSVVMVVNNMEARAVVQAMAKQENPVPIFSHWGLVGGDFFVPMHTALKKVDLRFVQSLLMTDAHARPSVNAFLQRYQKRYQLNEQEMIPSLIGSAHAYDLTHLLALAVKQAGSTERAAIRHALEALPRYNGVVRSYHPPFSKERHDALDHTQLRLARFDEQGRIVAAE